MAPSFSGAGRGASRRTVILCAALAVSLLPFLLRSRRDGGGEEVSDVDGVDQELLRTEAGENAASPPSTSSLVRYSVPSSCNKAEHECRRVDECNTRKWQPIPSCKKAAKKCGELTIAQQELMPFCKACLVSWRKMSSCGLEINNCAKARSWCYKARVRERVSLCEGDGIPPTMPLERINATAVSNACAAAIRVEALTHRLAIVARKLSDLPPPPPPGKPVRKGTMKSNNVVVKKPIVAKEKDDEPIFEDEPPVKPKYIDLTYK